MYWFSVDSGATCVCTGFNVNATNRGRAIIILYSAQGGATDNTGAGLYLVRCGYNGNNYVVTTIAESYKYESYKPTISANSDGDLTISSSVSGMALLLANK